MYPSWGSISAVYSGQRLFVQQNSSLPTQRQSEAGAAAQDKYDAASPAPDSELGSAVCKQ